MPNKIRAVDWSNDGKKIVVADSRAILYYYDKDLNFLDEYKGKPFASNSKKNNGWVEEVKFSPDSQYIVYGSHGASSIFEFLKAEDRKIKLLKDV
jgi:WD40 repeat protein